MNYNKVVEADYNEGGILQDRPINKHIGLKAFGIFSKLHFIAAGLVAAIALAIKLKYELTLQEGALIWYLGLMELFLVLGVCPSLYYMVVDSDGHFNRIFYNDVHVLFSLLMVIYGCNSIITCVYLFKGFAFYLAPRYHLIRLIVNLINLIFEGILYGKIKKNRNLSRAAITCFHTFISQILSFTVSAIILDIMFVSVYQDYWDIIFSYISIVYVLDILNGVYVIGCLALLWFKHDIVFAVVNMLYSILMIIMFKDDTSVLIPSVIYLVIVFALTIFTAAKHKRKFIGVYVVENIN